MLPQTEEGLQSIHNRIAEVRIKYDMELNFERAKRWGCQNDISHWRFRWQETNDWRKWGTWNAESALLKILHEGDKRLNCQREDVIHEEVHLLTSWEADELRNQPQKYSVGSIGMYGSEKCTLRKVEKNYLLGMWYCRKIGKLGGSTGMSQREKGLIGDYYQEKRRLDWTDSGPDNVVEKLES